MVDAEERTKERKRAECERQEEKRKKNPQPNIKDGEKKQ